MTFSRRILSYGVAIGVLVLMGAGIYFRIQDGEDDGIEQGREGPLPGVSAAETFATDVAIPVEAAPVIQDTLVLTVRAAGQAAAWRETTIRARVSGRIEELGVRENQRVREGHLLLRVDATEYELDVADARARVASAEAAFREQALFDDRIEDPAVRAERERAFRARSGLDQAEVALRKAELNLAHTRVTAPFAGRVASIAVVPGQWLNVGDEVMRIVDLDPIRVEVHVLEGEVVHLAPGRSARVTFAAFTDTVFTGTIETINPVVDPATRTAKVTVTIPNPDGRILPGMYARVTLDARRFPDRIMVPREAILERDRRTMLFVHENGLAKWRYVTTGLENETHVEIVPHPDTDMVRPGEEVLVGGHYTLTHDARIRIVENVRAAGGRPN